MWYVWGMKELDRRKLGRETFEEIRTRAVKRVEAGESPEVVIKALGLSHPRIYQWIAKYREGGIDCPAVPQCTRTAAETFRCATANDLPHRDQRRSPTAQILLCSLDLLSGSRVDPAKI
jgi:transposase-like protein